MSKRVEIAWQAGGTAVIDGIDGDRVELISTRAFAPGSRPEGTMVLPRDARSDGISMSGTGLTPDAPPPKGATARESAAAGPSISQPEFQAESPAPAPTIWLKVHGSRRQHDGAFRVKGRLLNVRREVLDLLKEVVPGPNSGKSSTP